MERAERIGEPLGRRGGRHCAICGRPLNNAEDPLSVDCGGDCLGCMADCEDPDCVAAVRALKQAGKI
jgi:hypothetical protein